MPVLVERATWIARASVLEARYRGGAAAFGALAPPERRCTDGELVAVSFADAWAARSGFAALSAGGLELFRDRVAGDVVSVDHRNGPEDWCPWIELAGLPVAGGGRVLAARAAGSGGTELVAPAGWRFEGSASQRDGVVSLRPADRPLRFVRLAPGAAVYEDRFSGAEVRVRSDEPPRPVVVETATGARHEVRAEVVRRGSAIELGLMHRDRLEPDAGMLFLFDRDARRSFWMKNTRIPLDMLFVSGSGVIVNVVERATPMTLAPCPSRSPCAAVLEVNAGWAEARRVGVGDRVVSNA